MYSVDWGRGNEKLHIKNIVLANFGSPKFGYPCRAVHKRSDFIQILTDVDFEPIVHMAAM